MPPTAPGSSVERYLASLATQRMLSPHTVGGYRRDLRVLQGFVETETPAIAIEAASEPQLRRYAAKLHGRGLRPRSIARALSAWRGYFTWLAHYEDGAANPVAGIRAPKLGKRLPKALSEEQTVRLLDAQPVVSDDDPQTQALAVRDAAIFELFYSSGLRLAELVGLDARFTRAAGHESSGWIDLVAGDVTVTGKGGKRRTVPIGSVAGDALRSWLSMRRLWIKAGDDEPALFVTARGTRLSGRTIQERLKAHARRAGIPANVHPHVLRHSFASHMLQATGDLRAVQELLGHASIAATQVYTSLDFQHLAAVYDAAHPRARRK